MTIKLQKDINLINERFETDLDEMMACYQTWCSPLELTWLTNFLREWLEKSNTFSLKHELKRTSSLWHSNTFIFNTYNEADYLIIVLHKIDRCDLLRNHVPNSDPAGGWTRNDRQYNIIIFATVLNLTSSLFSTSLTYPYHLTWSVTYLSRENFTWSLHKSKTFTFAWPLYYHG